MAGHKIYTRAYSNSSAGQFVSGKGAIGDPLSNIALLEEFRNHAKKWNQDPTALVSCSDRIVDSLKRAFDMNFKDGEPSADIWIAFIEVPDETATRIHSAKELAEKCELPEADFFYHEVVFEWDIPEMYVLHKVSFQTLMKRGLQICCLLQPSTREVRWHIARHLQQQSPWEIGVTLGCFARKFGARAPLNWISHQLFHDCVKVDLVTLNYAHGHTELVDFQFFSDLDDGIDTSLIDWWLSDIDFFLDSKEFKEWRDAIEESIGWDLIEFWETWHDADCGGTIKDLSAKEKLLYEEEENKLWVKHETKKAAIEAKAVKIGL